MTPQMTKGLVIAGFGVLAATAVAGWTHHPSTALNNNYGASAFAPQGVYSQTATGQPVTYDANGRAVYGQPNGQPVAYAAPGYAQPAANCVEPAMTYSNAAYVPAGSPAYRSTYRSTRYVRSYRDEPRAVRYVERDTTGYYHRGRSTKKSVAIVAGTAGVGAAIGALAGGGKGAAIGALSGGGAGFLYDRLTHNRVN
jgi:hypothetical protein